MARQRMVKPDFFVSESLASCSHSARLAFIGLWVMGDDYGNQKVQIRRLRHMIFPYDEYTDDDFLGLLCELEEAGCIKGYDIDGEIYLTVPNFLVYQTVRKPSNSNIPEPPRNVVKQKRTTVFHDWRTSGSPVLHQCGSDTPVTHQYATSSAKERKKEGSNIVLTNNIANELRGSVGADAAEAAPPSPPKCPLCGIELKSTGMVSEPWWCDNCKNGFAQEKVVA